MLDHKSQTFLYAVAHQNYICNLLRRTMEDVVNMPGVCTLGKVRGTAPAWEAMWEMALTAEEAPEL